MKKEELRERAKNRSRTMRTAKGTYYNAIPMSELNLLIDQLDDSEKVVIPQFAADFIKSKEKENLDKWKMASSFISHIKYKKGNAYKWSQEKGNMDKFLSALVNEYEVEQEPLYLAQVKGHSLTGSSDTYWHVVIDLYVVLAGRNEIKNGENKLTLKEWADFGITSENAEFTEVEE